MQQRVQDGKVTAFGLEVGGRPRQLSDGLDRGDALLGRSNVYPVHTQSCSSAVPAMSILR